MNIFIILLLILLILLILATTAIFVLITQNSRIKVKCEEEKMLDPETGMGNLQYFKYYFKKDIKDNSRHRYHIAYIILDNSCLRTYHNDTSFVDVMNYTTQVLTSHVGYKEILARITENGFAFAFWAADEKDAKKRLKALMNKLNSFETINDGKHKKLVFHAAVYNLEDSDKNCELLLFNLRKNCNKILGTDKQIIYCDVHSMNKIQEEKEAIDEIIEGLETNEFKMYLQFIIDNKNKSIVSAEALSRWERIDKGVVGPGNYIEKMEKTGLISKHDFYMFELACRQLEKWSNTEYKDLSISCNFTRITLSEEKFIYQLENIFKKYSFDKSKLAIEITEDAIEKDMDTAIQNVKKCKQLGFHVYLDDLGSGYTSLTNLCDYPIDVVKIDRDILLKAETPKGNELLSGIIALAHNLNIKVVCEGAETEEQNSLISQTDCDYIQGWYFSKPLPLEKCEPFINQYSKNSI